MSKILGIDLGTTNSAMAVIEGGESKVLENHEGDRTTPSVVALNKSGERLVGQLAKRQAVVNPKNTIFAVKRLIGRSFDDKETQEDKETFSYDIRKSNQGGIEVKMGDSSIGLAQEKWYKPEEISAMILQKLKADAEDKIGGKIEEAVITVPAYFDDSQRQATKQAGEIAGFKVRRIINEPTAAALAYGLDKMRDEKIVVYDLGGGTFDISVLEVGDNTVEVKSTGGDSHLGGEDFDNRIIEHLVREYKKQEGIDISKDPLALQRLREAAERGKRELSTTTETEINLPYITSGEEGPKHFVIKLTRAKLEELTKDLIDRAIELTKKTVTEKQPQGAGFSLDEINEIILVGGQTRMPAVQKAVRELFGKEPHKGINPDEVVAIGAAIQAGILQGDVKDVLLLDVTPLTLSIETLGGVATPMIPKNTTIPTNKSQTFSTAADNQTQVEIHILQGERPMAIDNKTLARFILDGIPPSPRGVPQVEVSFDIDANGILDVSAKDKATGKSQSVKIEASTSLTKEEVEQLKKDAEAHAEDDKKKKELMEVKNEADSLIYISEKSLKDAGDKVPEENKKKIEEGISKLKEAKEGNEAEAIKNAHEELSKNLQEIGQMMYNEANEEKKDKKDENESENNEPRDKKDA